MLEGSHEVIKESKNLEQVTQEINTAVNRINEITAKNRENINTLVREVSMFKVA
jgi:methyl-accepting chemotaxis protein